MNLAVTTKLIVEFMEPEGEGQLKQQFEQLKMTWRQRFCLPRTLSRGLPAADVKSGRNQTSPQTGRGLHDILDCCSQNAVNPAIEVIIYPTQVQGCRCRTNL